MVRATRNKKNTGQQTRIGKPFFPKTSKYYVGFIQEVENLYLEIGRMIKVYKTNKRKNKTIRDKAKKDNLIDRPIYAGENHGRYLGE